LFAKNLLQIAALLTVIYNQRIMKSVQKLGNLRGAFSIKQKLN